MTIFQAGSKVGVLTDDGVLFVGEVVGTGEDFGLRMTLLDAEVGLFSGNDLCVPFGRIRRAWICTNEHEVSRFIHEMQGLGAEV